VEIFIAHAAAKRAFDQLQANREPIETEFGAPLDWQRMASARFSKRNGLEDRKGCRIAVFRTVMDPNIEAQGRVNTTGFSIRWNGFRADVAPGSIEAPGLWGG
jgi:hypothetical protein